MSKAPPAHKGKWPARWTRHPRLIIGAALMVVTYPVVPHDFREPTRLLIAWNAGAWAYLVLIAVMMGYQKREARAEAAPEDEDQWMLVILGIVAAVAAIAAIIWELGPVKDMKEWPKVAHLGLVAASVLSSWTFIQTMFALHYAGAYYQPHAGEIRGGLEFPGESAPGWTEFLYQSFVIGCTFATSDVNVASKRMRGIVVIQGVVSFFFNTIILALAINIAAGLF